MEDVRAELLKELEEAQAELDRVEELLKERGEYGFGKGDPAIYQWEFNLALRDRQQRHIEEIRDALLRLDEGAYGVCQECGASIKPERLEVLPLTPLCITCARRKG